LPDIQQPATSLYRDFARRLNVSLPLPGITVIDPKGAVSSHKAVCSAAPRFRT